MDIFSYHLSRVPFWMLASRLVSSPALKSVKGLRHFELLMTMKMGRSVLSPSRYHCGTLCFFGWWEGEDALIDFLANPPYRAFAAPSWHVRMKFYRKWGAFAGLDDAPAHTAYADPNAPVIAVTLARLRISHAIRFAKWGRPVEAQIRDHEGKTCAKVAYRPLNTFLTFSIWKSEHAMTGMVGGRAHSDGMQHRNAMIERRRKPFHFQFITLRFAPLSQHGDWEPFRDETTPEGLPPLCSG